MMQIIFIISIITSSLCDHSDANIHVKGTTAIYGTVAAPNNPKRKVVIFEDSTPLKYNE